MRLYSNGGCFVTRSIRSGLDSKQVRSRFVHIVHGVHKPLVEGTS